MPERVVIPAPQGGTFLTMPCVDGEGWFGVKQVSVLPDNPGKGKPTVQAWYTLFDPAGSPVLACGAELLTRLRTAAVSALAASYLAPPQARTLLVVGTGSLAPWMAEAHAQVRNYRRVLVWGRSSAKAEATAAEIRKRLLGVSRPVAVEVVPDLAGAAGEAEVITAATTATTPPLRGAWLRPGQHLDLVGAFTPEMAEVDAEAVRLCDVMVDDLAAAGAEAGDLLRAVQEGWSFERVRGDLLAVVSGRVTRGTQPTLFKSVGLALEDLAVARLLVG